MSDVYSAAGRVSGDCNGKKYSHCQDTVQPQMCTMYKCSHLRMSVSGDFNSKQRSHNQDTVQCLTCNQLLRVETAASRTLYSGHCSSFSLRTVLEDFCCSCAEDLGGGRPQGASDGVF